jgi:flavin-binding protein dodecin
MSVAKSIEISAESRESFDHAIREGIKKANQSVDNLKSCWIENQEVTIGDDGNPEVFRVWMKATFILN